MQKMKAPVNEPVRSYEPKSACREELKAELNRLSSIQVDIPQVIGGQLVRSETQKTLVMPHDHRHVLGTYYWANASQVGDAILAAKKAKPQWEALSWTQRASIFLKAADLIAGPYRSLLNSATMLGQSKNAYQAEIDSACELVDFLRFNAYFYQQIQEIQPDSSAGVSNWSEYRALEGFVCAITPFNFTAIAANLPAAPALLGNTVVWKPSDTQMLSAHFTLQIFREAGLPDGVINLVVGDPAQVGQQLLTHSDLAGVHFTGSTATFQSIWRTLGQHVSRYRSYPRLVGETGGKDFIFAHASADVEALATAMIRGAFEYQGQKCSAASRAYVPRSIWAQLKGLLLSQMEQIQMGDVRDFKNFMNAVIDERAFDRIAALLAQVKNSTDAEILFGGGASKEKGYFIEPTLIQVQNPTARTMVEEIFGPVLSVYVYDEAQMEEVLDQCDQSTAYALTGAIFATDRFIIEHLSRRLRHAAGNFYINDKPTGAVVGQQPFGGSRASGTNDKAGSLLNLLRWVSPRTVKETYVPPRNFTYSFMKES